jgi:hypothetical protein
MITLRCTRKVLDRLGVPASSKGYDTPTNALGDWYVNLLRFGRDQVVMATSERSLLTVLLPARELRHRLVPELLRGVASLLRDLDVPEDIVARELEAMQPIAFAPTASRSVLASMNNLAQTAEWQWGRNRSPEEIMLALAETPMTALAGGGWPMGYPSEAARRLLGLDAKRPPPRRLLRLRITLVGAMPVIWRRVLVPDTIRLPTLHRVIQIAMGWEDAHLHEFEFGDARYGVPDPDGVDTDFEDERGKVLAELLARHKVEDFKYRYDFGDDWVHRVEVEGTEDNAGEIATPTCIDGAGACPPEDVAACPATSSSSPRCGIPCIPSTARCSNGPAGDSIPRRSIAGR